MMIMMLFNDKDNHILLHMYLVYFSNFFSCYFLLLYITAQTYIIYKLCIIIYEYNIVLVSFYYTIL